MGVNGETGGERRPREIRVEIGELALHGFRVDPDRVSAAFEHELTRLISEHGVPLATDGALSADTLAGLPRCPPASPPAAWARSWPARCTRGSAATGR